MGLYGAPHGWGGKKAPLSKICYLTHHCYTLPKENPKIIYTRNTDLQFYWHQYFFTGNQQFLLYLEIQIQTAF